MDALIKHAEQLAQHRLPFIAQPVAGRVAYVVNHGQYDATNGDAVRTQGIAEALNHQGLEVLCFVRPGCPWAFYAKRELSPDVEVNGVTYIQSRWPYGVVPRGQLANLNASVECFVERFRVYRPAVVVAASNWEAALPAWVAAKRMGVPFCFEVRSFGELANDAREPGYAHTLGFREEAARDSFIARNANQVFTLNASMKAELIKRGVQPQRISVVPNGLRELPTIQPIDAGLKRQLEIWEGDNVIGYLGSFHAYEGLDVLFQACESLISKGINIKLLLVGDEQPLTSAVNSHQRDADKPWLIQVGRASEEQLAKYYALMDCVVIPRKAVPLCELTPPTKVLEALAYGKRLVMSKLPALEDACPVVKGVSFAKADDVEALVAAMAQVLEDVRVERLSNEQSAEQEGVQSNAVLQGLDTNVLTFSRLTQGMVETLEMVVNEPTPLLALQQPQNEPEGLDDVTYSMASQWFYKEGRLTDTLLALQSLQARGVKFDKPKRDFEAFVAGLARLKGGMALPPRQPNAGLMSRRQQVLYCLHQSVPHATNGYSTRSHGIAVGLQESGWNVRATTRPGFPWDGGARGLPRGYHEATVDGVAYAACAGWNLAKTPLDLYLAEAADHYLREAQTSGAEVIVAASNHITALPALIAARRLGLPFVYEVRGLWEITQASTQPEWAGSERYQLMRELEQQAALEADLVITLTEELADELASWGVERERITVVPNAVNAERFTPRPADIDVARQLKLPAGVPVIGYAGSAVAYEGLELLLEALAKLKSRGQAFVFVLVGDGKVIDAVKATAKTLGIEKNCRFTGRVAFEQVPRYLSCMDIMPIPRLSSAVTEMVSALKPLEAMAMGKAVVLSDVSPHQVMAGPGGERARLFEKDNAAALSNAIEALINNPAERERLGKAARAWIDRERTWNHVTSIYARSLQQLRESVVEHQRKQRQVEGQTNAKTLAQLTLGLIGDTFTTDTLASAVKVVPLSPDNWREQIKEQPIDALFVESAWKGNDWQWFRQVGHYSVHEFAALDALLAHCRRKGIPSLFWNKEDPVHFDRFRATAAKCDHVFTTDSRRIIPYLTTPGALTQTASSAPFYASPKIHNLLPSTREWQPTAAYGGTYYGKRYPERTEYMDKIMSAAAPLGLTLYDRQHDDPKSPYKYPGGLGNYVAGSLSYEEMIQAYKAHPVQINVNSVLDSPTMFSRRVVETAACGSPMLSGPALGMNRYLEGAGHVVRTESDAAQALENLMHYPAYRWRVALKGARAVMRAHTTELRLTQMLRTAGMVVQAPEPPAYSIYTSEMTPAGAQRVLAQTVRPICIVSREWQAGTRAQLEAEGIRCATPDGERVAAETLWLLANPRALEGLEAEDLEDLIWPTFYAPHKRIAFSRQAVLEEGAWPGVAVENSSIDTSLQLLRPDAEMALSQLQKWGSRKPTLTLRKPPQVHAQAPNVPPKKTVVIAGHDLKFIKPFYPYFTKAGMRVLLDFWTGHNHHNETASKRLVRQADTVFCEWTLGNAIWYAKHKIEGQRLVGRLHAQELRNVLFDQVPFDAFDKVIFVGPHMLRNAQQRNPALKKNGVVIYNGVDIDAMQAVPRQPTNGKVLGLVGMVPQSKRLDRALDILKELRKEDTDYILRVKGKRPEDFAWMVMHRPEEMAWYEEQYRRLQDDPLLKDAVIFDPHGNDMPQWYAGVDFILSVSDHESFHLAVAEGAASGCTPIVLPWEGADEIYPKEWLYSGSIEAARSIKVGSIEKAGIRREAKLSFYISDIASKLLGSI